MLNDIYQNPTTIYFGAGMEERIGTETSKYSRRILLHYGVSSIFSNGIYKNIATHLTNADIYFVELGGVEPNPKAELVREGINLCRRESLDFILAVGGGSVIDSAKAVAIGAPWKNGDFFEIFDGKHQPQEALKVGGVLTNPGSGSESNSASVVTCKKNNATRAYGHPLMMPVFSILNPAFTCSLSPYQTACGAMDAISHVMERYFTNVEFVDCTDRIGEGLVKTLMKYVVLAIENPKDYNYRAEIMWASKLANDNTAGFGRKHDFSSHRIAHGIAGIYDTPHAATITVVLLAWVLYVHKTNVAIFLRFASRVFDIDTKDLSEAQVIHTMVNDHKELLKRVGLPTTLRELGIKDETRFEEIADNAVKLMPSGTIGHFTRLTKQDIVEILKIAH